MTKTLFFLASVAILALTLREFLPAPVSPTEHGLRTRRVVATRYQNPVTGYNIGFEFPENPGDCDRTELSEFIESHGGSIYQMGGSPGAPIYAAFEGVTDKTSANAKLAEILPALDALVGSL